VGLICFWRIAEQIMPAIGTKDPLLSLLAWVVSDPAVQQCFRDIHHILHYNGCFSRVLFDPSAFLSWMFPAIGSSARARQSFGRDSEECGAMLG
jgi:hypothetical protein